MRMKNFKYVMILFVALTATVSCSDDSADDVNPIVGTWAITESAEGIEISLEATFQENNKGTMMATVSFGGESASENSTFSWSTEGDQLTMTMDGETEVSTFVIVGNKLTITDSEGDITILTRV